VEIDHIVTAVDGKARLDVLDHEPELRARGGCAAVAERGEREVHELIAQPPELFGAQVLNALLEAAAGDRALAAVRRIAPRADEELVAVTAGVALGSFRRARSTRRLGGRARRHPGMV